MSLQSPLGRIIPNSMDCESVKRDGWNEHGILVVALNDERLDWIKREQIKQLGEYLYGKRTSNN